MKRLKSIDLSLFEKLQDKEFRDAFFEQEFLDNIAIDIRALRKLRNLRQVDVAAATRMQQSAVSRIEQAEYSNWNCKTLLRLAQALDAKLTISWDPIERAVENYKTTEPDNEIPSVLKARDQASAEARDQASADNVKLQRNVFFPFNRVLTDRPVNQLKPFTPYWHCRNYTWFALNEAHKLPLLPSNISLDYSPPSWTGLHTKFGR